MNYDFLVYVALDEHLGSSEFYVFTRDDVERAGDVQIERFRSVRKKLHLFRTKKEFQEAVRVKPDYVTNWKDM